MNIFDRTKRAISFIAGKSALTDPMGDIGWRTLVGGDKYKTPVSVDEMLQKYTSWTYGNIKAISQAVSTIDFKLMKVSNKGEEIDEVKEHPFLDLLYRPNAFMTKSDWIKLAVNYLLSTGEIPLRLRRNNPLEIKETPFEMWPISPEGLTVNVGRTKDNFQLVTSYKTRIDGQEVTLKPWEVVFINNMNPRNIWRGMGVVEAALMTIDSLDYAEDWNVRFFQNSARPDVVLYTEQKLDEATIKRVSGGWNSAHQGHKNAHGTAILEAGLKLERFQNSIKDMDFVELQKYMRDKEMALFGVTKVILGIVEDVNRANAESSEYVFNKYTVKPIMGQLCEYLNEFLLPVFDPKGELFLTFTDPVPENQEMKLKEIETRAKYKLNTLNELRAMLGDGPVDGGDEIKFDESGVNVNATRSTSSDIYKVKYADALARYKNRDVRRKQMIEELTQKILKTIKKSKSNPKNRIKYKNVREKATTDTYIKAISAKEDTFEETLKPIIVKYYDAQLKEMEIKLNGKKEPTLVATDFIFSKETSVEFGINLMTPAIEAMILEIGAEAFELLNISRPYSLLDQARRYLDKAPAKAIKSMTNTAYKRAREILSEGIKEGLSTQELIKNIRTEYKTLKTDQVAKVARTEVSRATGFAQIDAYKQSGVVQGKEWIVTSDDRLCPICASFPVLYKERMIKALNEPFFKNGEKIKQVDPLTGEPLLNKDGTNKTFIVDYGDIHSEPAHVNCRCQVLPVLEPIKSVEPKQKTEQEIREELKNEVLTEMEQEVYGRRTEK